MSDNLTYQEQCKINDEMIVYGYVRINFYAGSDICTDIINLCVNYYHVGRDKFDENKIGTFHDLNGNVIGHRAKQGYQWSTSVLTNIISNGKYCWKFKVIKAGVIMIGVCRSERIHLVQGKFFPRIGKGYGWMVTHGRKFELIDSKSDEEIDMKCKDNDIISMYLDLDQLSISYCLNEINEVMTITDIDKSEYTAAVYTFREGDTVELLESGRILQ